MRPPDEQATRRQKIIEGLRGRDLDQAVADPDLLKAMREEAESDDPNRLVTARPDPAGRGGAGRPEAEAAPRVSSSAPTT